MTPRSLLASNAFAFRIATIDGATGGFINGGVELQTDDPEDGMGIRDPGGNVSSMTSTSTAFADANNDTIAHFGDVGLRFIEPSTNDTVFNYDPTTSSLEIGLGNTVTGAQSVALGSENVIVGDRSFAVGFGNDITSHNSFSVGANNQVDGLSSFAGGSGSLATNFTSAVLCGSANEATGYAAVVGGGWYNRARGNFSVVLGGGTGVAADSNVAQWHQTAILGRVRNYADGRYSSIAGGDSNTSNGQWSTIGGGQGNYTSGDHACVPGGSMNTAAQASLAAGTEAEAIFSGSFVWNDASGSGPLTTTAPNQFLIRASGGVGIGTNAPAHPLHMASGAHCTAGGTWTNASDANLKENFQPVDADEVLEMVAELPITKWNYRNEASSITHIGPTAQDFLATFGVGGDDKSISTIDPSGVALAAIQALRKRNLDLEAQIAELRNMILENAKE